MYFHWPLDLFIHFLQVIKEASRLYAASWVRDIGPELRPNDYKKEENADRIGGVDEKKEKEPTTLEDLGKNFCILSQRLLNDLKPFAVEIIRI